MPVIAVVDGVRVCIFYNDHDPPHVHAYFAEHEVRLTIDRGDVLSGYLPRSKLRDLEQWRVQHLDDLHVRWSEARTGQRIEKLP